MAPSRDFGKKKWDSKQSICEFNIEKEHIQPPKDLSTAHKVRKSEHFHKHGEISKEVKVFTSDSNPTSDPRHYERFRHDCLYIPYRKGDFFPEFDPEHTGSCLISLQKLSGVIHDIDPVDIWRRSTGHPIVHVTQRYWNLRSSPEQTLKKKCLFHMGPSRDFGG
jgi:hypothetical protein